MTVYMFDRDYTVDVNPHPDKEAVPLEWIKYLARETDNPVFATGNQHLRREALIPGLQEAKQIWEAMTGEDVTDEYEGRDFGRRYKPTRRDGLRLVQEIHPDQTEFIVVDDVNLQDLSDEGIHHYYPWEFYDVVVNEGRFNIPVDGGDQHGEPENARDNDVSEWLDNNGFYRRYESLGLA